MSKGKNVFKKIYNGMGSVLEVCGMIVAGALFILLAYQIILRIFFSKGDTTANEFVSYLFIWLIYIGMAIAAKNKEHVCVTMLIDSVPEKAKTIIQLVSRCMWLYYSVFISIASYRLIRKVIKLHSVTPVVHMPLYLVYIVLPVTHIVCSIYIIRDIIQFIQVLCGRRTYESTQKKSIIDELKEEGALE